VADLVIKAKDVKMDRFGGRPLDSSTFRILWYFDTSTPRISWEAGAGGRGTLAHFSQVQRLGLARKSLSGELVSRGSKEQPGTRTRRYVRVVGRVGTRLGESGRREIGEDAVARLPRNSSGSGVRGTKSIADRSRRPLLSSPSNPTSHSVG
jgi:hypothetical protein